MPGHSLRPCHTSGYRHLVWCQHCFAFVISMTRLSGKINIRRSLNDFSRLRFPLKSSLTGGPQSLHRRKSSRSEIWSSEERAERRSPS